MALYPETEYADRYQLDDHVLTVTDMPVKGDVSLIEFYFNGFKGVQDDKYYTTGMHEDGTEGRKFVLDDKLSYTFDYNINGKLDVSSEATEEDFRVTIALDADC